MRTRAVITTIVVSILIILACNRIKKVLLVSTGDASEITTTTSSIKGSVIDLGDGADSYGHCYGTSPGLTIDDTKTSLGIPPAGDFTSHLTGLIPGTKYYYRAYLSGGAEIAYGDEKSFNTIGIVVPSLTTTAVTDINQTTVSSGGNITGDGGGVVTERGVCWSTSQNPMVTGNHTSDGPGNGSFTSFVTGLIPGTAYYLRAYATNSAGTAYGNEVNFSTKTATVIKDRDGNSYNIIDIGTQSWMDKNLRTSVYNDSSLIPLVTDNAAWSSLSTPGFCWYHNDKEGHIDSYGALYNWHAVNTGKLCPAGWHVASDAEWTVLITKYGGINAAGGLLKETGTSHWDTPNTGATNVSLFTALPGGYRHYNGTFASIGSLGYWWSATPYGTTSTAWRLSMSYNSAGMTNEYLDKNCGFSVRCIKN